ncbi:LuxR C-terminal-related transcriptional regulator [Streptomyces sp. KL118A]|uniref:ATP-binding protein n=1 Tax=Streptomyces sp. KL118A TaxID=3045153 RepID=UPI00278C69F9|nr:LuxR C-terminal-related transcriptional regulator [Streptomyces sp. KL118A]
MSTDLHTWGTTAELVGRELDLVAVQGRLQDHSARLITLTGAGGVGKSRLAAEAARRTAGLFPGGIHPLDLPACADLETALKHIDQIVAGTTRRTLLLLDGVEHVAAELAPVLAGHLTAAPALTVLATGQEVLRIYGEQVVPVPPLPTPGPLLAPDVADVQDNPAVRLLTGRAHAANPAFALTAENVEAVVDICNLLEGVPLVLELAARRLRLYPAQELRAWLRRGGDSHLPGPVDVPPRQRSTPAIAEWSCRGLSQGQRALLARLALFRHGLTLATAEKVSPLDAGETAVALEALLDRNLLTLEENPRTDSRLTMSRTLRAWGLALLDAAGAAQAAAARQAHARHYQKLLHTLEGRFQGSEQQRWLRAAAAEHDNVLAALHHLKDEHERRTAARGRLPDRDRPAALLERAALICASLYPWLIRGELTEGLRWFDSTERALQDEGAEDGEEPGERLRARARLCAGAGVLAAALGDHDGAAHRHRRALDMYQRLRDPGPAALASARRGYALFRCGDRAAGQSLLSAARTTLNVQGDTAGSAEAATALADVLLAGGESEPARALLERAERIQRQHGAIRDLARTLSTTARLHLHTGDEAAARAALRESIGLYESIDERTELPAVLDLFALLLVRTAGQPQRATRLLAAAEALRSRTGATTTGADRDLLQATVTELRRQLGATLFAAARAEGLRLRPEAMAGEALATAEPGRAEERSEAGALTPRQLQVALLVADGLTNRQIAHQLDIAEWTVVNHVRHVMRKLGCNSRVQVAWAVGRRQ